MEYRIKKIELCQFAKMQLKTREEIGILLITGGRGHLEDGRGIGIDTLLICKPRQTFSLIHTGGRIPLKAMWIGLSLRLLEMFSTEQTDLTASFQVNPAALVCVQAKSETLMLLKSLAMQMNGLEKEQERYAIELLERSTVQMFLALVLRSCVQEDPYRIRENNRQRSGLSLDDVFLYIHTHLTEEITLKQMGQMFYVSQNYLNSEFKKRTGQTVHRYIVRARLDLCRRYIEQGYAINQIYHRAGFGSYNHFFRAFKQAYGMTPKEYYRSVSGSASDIR